MLLLFYIIRPTFLNQINNFHWIWMFKSSKNFIHPCIIRFFNFRFSIYVFLGFFQGFSLLSSSFFFFRLFLLLFSFLSSLFLRFLLFDICFCSFILQYKGIEYTKK